MPLANEVVLGREWGSVWESAVGTLCRGEVPRVSAINLLSLWVMAWEDRRSLTTASSVVLERVDPAASAHHWSVGFRMRYWVLAFLPSRIVWDRWKGVWQFTVFNARSTLLCYKEYLWKQRWSLKLSPSHSLSRLEFKSNSRVNLNRKYLGQRK